MSQSSVDYLPFLKWAGGKRNLANRIREILGQHEGSYIEPFLGGGAVALSMGPTTVKMLGDANQGLIDTYIAIRDELDGVLETLNSFENSEYFYLQIRGLDRQQGFAELPLTFRAARFIYLNRLGFNGLYRENSKGYFNVPFGRQMSKDFVMEDRLRKINHFLNFRDENGVLLNTLICGDFESLFTMANFGDAMYADPPYDPVSSTSSFVGYQHSGFGNVDQIRLRDVALDAVNRGVRVVLSNNDTEFIRDIYDGFELIPVEARRSISASNSGRGRVKELIIVGR